VSALPPNKRIPPSKRLGRLVYGISEFAHVMGQSRATVWRKIRSGKLKTVDVAGRTMIPSDAIKPK
jgi:hypothetical protein